MNERPPILYVEDDPGDVELTLTALAECRLANPIVVARDGQEALDYLTRRGGYAERPPGTPAFVILDLKMPKVDGFAVLRRMRADPDLRLVPVVMLTSSRALSDLRESYSLGANAYVVKPIEFAPFALVIRQMAVFWAVTNERPPQ